jgi:hypothetical protein
MSTGQYESRPIKIVLEQARWSEFSQYGLSYQSCRFCHRGIVDRLKGLWKYSVRHYICDDCRKKALA